MRTLALLAACTCLVGCLDSYDSASRNVDGEGEGDEGEVDRDDCKIEGSAIGQEGVTLSLGEKTVTFHDWVGKADSPGEFVGFSLTLAGGDSISYVVKAGGELHPSTALVWLHPNGDAGDQVPGISNVDTCDDDPPGDDEPPCDDPDGCDGGDEPPCDTPDGCPDPGDGPIT